MDQTLRPQNPLSEAQEDYLKQILLLGSPAQGVRSLDATQSVSTQALADVMQIKPASVTGMLKKLAELSLVDYEAYRGVRLTDAGYKVALEILRHHRLLEAYLHQALGYGWDEVHAEAEKLEHHISEALEARIAEWLGHPSHDPHGDPIPTRELQLPHPTAANLAAFEVGQPLRLMRVSTQDRGLLNLFTRLGLVPGTQVTLLEKSDTAYRIDLGHESYLLPVALALLLWFDAT